MAKPPAVDTSVLIFLTKGDLLNLLKILNSEIVVPLAVAAEIAAYGETDVTAQVLASTDWLVKTEASPGRTGKPPAPVIINVPLCPPLGTTQLLAIKVSVSMVLSVNSVRLFCTKLTSGKLMTPENAPLELISTRSYWVRLPTCAGDRLYGRRSLPANPSAPKSDRLTLPTRM